MTNLHFEKWQATGNDFIIVDNRDQKYSDLSTTQINRLCDRKFGIGADGFMMLENHAVLDFEMRYFNADGLEAEMCGNGARAIIAFAHQLEIINDKTLFQANDGPHTGSVLDDDNYRIKMIDVNSVETHKIVSLNEPAIVLNTGVPHLVCFVDNVDDVDVVNMGREIRYSQEFKPAGTNVNFVQITGESLKMRTYERGVEDETLSCGTGAVASAIASANQQTSTPSARKIEVKVPGGQVEVEFTQTGKQIFRDIYLKGPAKKVFSGITSLVPSTITG